VLDGNVDLQQPLTDEPAGQGWTKIECASKKAYGCGEQVREAVEGLTLYVRRGDTQLVNSSLAIRMSDNAFQTFKSVSQESFGAPHEGIRGMYAVGRILMADEDLILVLLSFYREIGRDISYFLVYDDADASLSLIDFLPDPHKACCASRPVASRTAGGGAFELLFVARGELHFASARSLMDDLPDVLCVFSPAAAAEAEAADRAACPWQIKGRRFPREKIREPFVAHSVFSFQGMCFWADLAQGIVYCDLQHATTSGAAEVDFGFIELPPGCQLNLEKTLRLWDDPKNLTRTMCCVNDSIWFVCIDQATELANDLLTMWTLKMPEGQWKKEGQISALEIWGLHGFKEAGLPEVAPEFPIVTDDGVLRLVLTELQRSRELVGHICSIDVFNKKLLEWRGLVHNYHIIKPVILPANFFQGKMHDGQHKETGGL
jgi:hypothetical protein